MPVRHLGAVVVSVGTALFVLAAWAWTSVAAGIDGLGQYRVERPGVVLVDRDARRRDLAAMGQQATHFCRLDDPSPLADPDADPVPSLEGRLGYGGNNQLVAPFDWSLIVYGTRAFSDGNAGAHATFMDIVTDWARANALTEVEDDVAGSNTAVLFNLRRTLALLIPTWAKIRNDARTTVEERETVDIWIGKLVDLADVNTGSSATRATRRFDCTENPETSNCNNHRYLRDEVNMMWGALVGDHERFRKGVERFTVALRQMRPDGSLPLETARGARALWLQNQAIGMLVTMAEIAALQGHDLYNLEIEGRSLHRAIAFLIEGIRRPQAVFPYAEANRSPAPGTDWREQDLRFTELRARWHEMAWIEAYLARFPEHPNAERLREELPGLFLDRPLISRVAGGMTSCLHGLP